MLIVVFVAVLASFMIIAAKNHNNKTVIKSENISKNVLLAIKEKPLEKVKTSDNPLIFDTEDEMISFYSKVFMLKEDIIKKGKIIGRYDITSDDISNEDFVNKINELIDIDKKAWNNDYILNNVKYLSKEEAILKTIANIYKNPAKYNLNKKDINTTKYELGNFKPEELIYKFASVLDVNPYIALSIAYCECGYKLNSYLFVHKHNIGGIRGSKGFVSYKNEAYGIYKFILMLHSGYKVTETSGKDKIISMSKRYAGGSEHWVSTVSSYYDDLNKKGFEHYYNKGKHDRKLNIPYIEV